MGRSEGTLAKGSVLWMVSILFIIRDTIRGKYLGVGPQMSSYGEKHVLVLGLGVGCFQVLMTKAVLRSLRSRGLITN